MYMLTELWNLHLQIYTFCVNFYIHVVISMYILDPYL